MALKCKTHFQCPCCKEVYELDASATVNIRLFLKDLDTIETNRLVSVVLDNPQRIPSPREEYEEKPKKVKRTTKE